MSAPVGSGPVMVLGAVGGCGASLLAGGLALAWQRAGGGAWVVELRTGRGDLAGAWGLPGDRTLADLAVVAEEVGPDHLAAAAQRHDSGVTALVASADPLAPAWDAAAAGRLVGAVASVARRSAVDAGTGLGPAARGAAVAAARVLVVCPSRLAGARRARALVNALAGLGAHGGSALVVASGPVRGEVGRRSLAKAVGAPLVGEMPWAPREAAALGAGLWPRGRRRPLAAAVASLAEALG